MFKRPTGPSIQIKFTGVPNVGEGLVSDWNGQFNRTWTFGNPSAAYPVTIGITAADTALNFANKINEDRTVYQAVVELDRITVTLYLGSGMTTGLSQDFRANSTPGWATMADGSPIPSSYPGAQWPTSGDAITIGIGTLAQAQATGLIGSLLPAIDSILGVRDTIGALKAPVFLITRTWYTDSGRTSLNSEVGGYARDVEVQLLPSPEIINFAQDVRIRQGGAVEQGDVLLRNVSKNLYEKTDLDGTSTAQNVQKFYRVGTIVYQVRSVVEKYVTWDVQVRPLTDQTRYP